MDFEILKTGLFTIFQCKVVNTSQSDLNINTSSYNPTISKSHIVIDHPKSNNYSCGCIDSIKVNGVKLIASASKIVSIFITALKNGFFKKRSVSLNPNNSLRHLEFLGATLPTVKGLAVLQFNDAVDSQIFELMVSELVPSKSVVSVVEAVKRLSPFQLPKVSHSQGSNLPHFNMADLAFHSHMQPCNHSLLQSYNFAIF